MLTPSKIKINNTIEYISLLDLFYPIGTIYLTTGDDSPITIFGGTWVKIENALLSASGTSYGTAGATSGTSTISTAMMPSHTHTGPNHYHSVNLTAASNGAHTHTLQGIWTSGGVKWYTEANGLQGKTTVTTSSSGSHTHSVSGNTGSAGTGNTGATGGGSSFIPYHYNVNVWRRTA